jgi:hypothetical protein
VSANATVPVLVSNGTDESAIAGELESVEAEEGGDSPSATLVSSATSGAEPVDATMSNATVLEDPEVIDPTGPDAADDSEAEADLEAGILAPGVNATDSVNATNVVDTGVEFENATVTAIPDVAVAPASGPAAATASAPALEPRFRSLRGSVDESAVDDLAIARKVLGDDD